MLKPKTSFDFDNSTTIVTRAKGERIEIKYGHLCQLFENKGTDDITQFRSQWRLRDITRNIVL